MNIEHDIDRTNFLLQKPLKMKLAADSGISVVILTASNSLNQIILLTT